MPWKAKVSGPTAAATPTLFTGGASLGARGKRSLGLAPYLGGDKGREREESRKMRGLYKPGKWREGAIREPAAQTQTAAWCACLPECCT